MSYIHEQLKHIKKEVHNNKRKHQQETAMQLKSELPPALQRSAELATEDGASSWLTAIPLDQYGFTLHKRGISRCLLPALWLAPTTPSLTLCACGQAFTIGHALSCPTGGYPSTRHNEL